MLAVSVAGGDNQDQMTLQLLVDSLDFGLSSANRDRPEIHDGPLHQLVRPEPPVFGQLRINPELGQGTIDALEKLGHKPLIRKGPLSAAPSVISINHTPRAKRRRRVIRRTQLIADHLRRAG